MESDWIASHCSTTRLLVRLLVVAKLVFVAAASSALTTPTPALLAPEALSSNPILPAVSPAPILLVKGNEGAVWNTIKGHPIADVKSIVLPIQIFSQLYETWDQTTPVPSLMKEITDVLFPWAQPLGQLVKNFPLTKSQGIAICVEPQTVKQAFFTLMTIREFLGSKLPVEVFYVSEKSLDQAQQDLFTGIRGVIVKNLNQVFAAFPTDIDASSCKSFAILASSFRETILVDPDVVFVKKPDYAFIENGYQWAGTLFFYDRTSKAHPGEAKGGPGWIRDLIPEFAKNGRHIRYMDGSSLHEQDSGVVVMDKKRTLVGLLTICLINSKKFQKETHSHILAKEMFWVGMEIARQPQGWGLYYGGSAGSLERINKHDSVCGRPAYSDDFAQLFWFNGGFRNLSLGFYGMDQFVGLDKIQVGTKGKGQECLWIHGMIINPVTPQQSKMIDLLNDLWRQSKL